DPALRPLIPWRGMVDGGAALAGAAAALWRARRGPILPRDRRRRRRVALGAAAAALVLVPLTLVRWGADPDAKGMAISASPLLSRAIDWVRRANDLDGDGFGSLLGEKDCAPFDASIRPGVRDLPDDGIDQNCDGHDFSMRELAMPPAGEKMPVPEAFRKDWNVLLITIDAVRYDHTTFGGYAAGPKHRDTTPRLAELVDKAVSFTFANAPSAGTMASVPAILTSKFFHSGIALDENVKPHMPPRLKPENTTLPEIMKRGGYKTGAILSHEYFNDWGMEQGVDDYDNTIGKKPDAFRVSSPESTDRSISWISRHARDKWFLWVHYLDPHGRYVAHPDDVDYGSTEEDLYDSEIHYADRYIGRLLDELARTPGGDRTIVIITSDHGDGFNEHGFVNHGQALYRELLNVPLIFYVPDVPPRRIGGAVSPLDIVPTVADLCGIDVSDLSFEGRSLVPQIFYGKEDPKRVVFAETNYPKPLRAAVSQDYKLIYDLQNNLYQLYRLEADPWEKTNLASKDPQALAEMQTHLDAWLSRVMFERDAVFNQATSKVKDVLLTGPPSPRFPVTGTTFDGGRIELIGWDLDPPDATYVPGDKLYAYAYLHVKERPSGTFKLQMLGWLVDQAGFDPHAAMTRQVVRSPQRITAEGYLPSDQWQAGDYLRERFGIIVPASWAREPGDGVALGVAMAGSGGKVDAAGAVPAGDDHV
ncbi:MAG: sulfatase-like hydrolase/transferase, partial [Kofleriaceae bacterium]|nr:sulfatase-like hydrolase/transferase [Kofleriaceae bacterium]